MSSVSARGTTAAQWDKDTWAPLADLAQNHPDAGVHFQGTIADIKIFLSGLIALTIVKSARITTAKKTWDQ